MIQSSAHLFDYVPIISFSDLYLRDTGNEDDSICEAFGKQKYLLPFSKLKNASIPTRFLTKPACPVSVEKFLNEKYPVDVNIKFNKFLESEQNIKNLFSQKKHRQKLEGIERFPIQFYTPFN